MLLLLISTLLAIGDLRRRFTEPLPDKAWGENWWAFRLGLITCTDALVLAGAQAPGILAIAVTVVTVTTTRDLVNLPASASSATCLRIALPALLAGPALFALTAS